MTVLSSIVPGKVVNHGIRDLSIPDYEALPNTYPLHLPVVSMVLPKGPLASDAGTVWVNMGEFTEKFGNIFDTKSPYYNPTSVLINALATNGQSTIGVRRLSENNSVARVALSAFVQKVEVEEFERDSAGNYKRDEDGEKVPTGNKVDGLKIVVKPDPEAKSKQVGDLVIRTIPAVGEEPETTVFPLFEAIAGVGDFYNLTGMNFGVRNSAIDYRAVSEFVRDTGTYPFQMRQFTLDNRGTQRFAKTRLGNEVATVTLFETELRGVNYSLRDGFGEYTGKNINRPTPIRSAPFEDVYAYEDNIVQLTQMMYVVEEPLNDTLVDVNEEPWRQMNPFTCVNHTGAPYYGIVGDEQVIWDMTGSVQSTGGVSPFLTNEGELPDYVTVEPVNDPLGLLAGIKQPVTRKQAWEINNRLLAGDLANFISGKDPKNYSSNRQSIFWDVGYEQYVKEESIKHLSSRQDIIVMQCATVWEPNGKVSPTDIKEIYSRATYLVNLIRLHPESIKWGTAACRAAINIRRMKIADERTGNYFSGNIDLATRFAQFAGNGNGIIYPANSPDSGVHRNLTIGHGPDMDFEDDEIAADNFSNGFITVRPADAELYFRPALPTVYSNPDSVLKDVVTTFLCVCIEKIAQDEWNTLSGDTTKSAADYQALFKDGVERKCRDRLGGLVKRITVEPYYTAGQVGSRATMNSTIHAYFNKGKYMMNLDLFAYNEQDA